MNGTDTVIPSRCNPHLRNPSGIPDAWGFPAKELWLQAHPKSSPLSVQRIAEYHMSEYAAQVEAAVACLKQSCAEGPFKALLRELSDIVRKILASGPYSQRVPKRIELTKLNRENVSTDDLKTLLSTLGFDDDRQRPSCMIITDVNTNALGAFLNEAARELNCVEGLTSSFPTFSASNWPDSELQDNDTWELLPDDHPQMRVINRYFVDQCHPVSRDDSLVKISAVFSYYFCTALMSLPVFLRFLHSVGPVDRLHHWLRIAKAHIDKSAVLLDILPSSTPRRISYEMTIRKVENFVQYTAFAPNFKEDFQTIQEEVNSLFEQLKVEMQKPARSQLMMIFRYCYNLSYLITQVTPLTIFMPLHAPDISDDTVRNFCRSARAIRERIRPEYRVKLEETSTFLSKHAAKLAYDELSSLLIHLAAHLVVSTTSTVTPAVASTTVSSQSINTQHVGVGLTEQLPADSDRMLRLLGTATDVTMTCSRLCSDAVLLGISQEEYEQALSHQLDADMERESHFPASHSAVTSPQAPRQQNASGSDTHTTCDSEKDDLNGKDKRDAFTSSQLPVPWEEDDSGLATDEQSGQQVDERSGEVATLLGGQMRSDGRKIPSDNVDDEVAVPAAAATVRWQAASQESPSHQEQFKTPRVVQQEHEIEEVRDSASESTCSSAVQHFNEIVEAAPEAFSIAYEAARAQLHLELRKKDELEKLYRSPTTQALQEACSVLQKEIQAAEERIASLQREVQRWERLSTISSKLLTHKEGKRVP